MADRKYKRFAGQSVNNAGYHNFNWDLFHDGNELRDVSFASLSAAIQSAAADSKTLFITTKQRITSNTTIPANISIVVLKGGSFDIASGKTLRILGPFQAGLFQVFTGSGTVTLSNAENFIPQWWGAKGDGVTDDYAGLQAAINAKIAGGQTGRVYIPAGNYKTTRQLVIDSNSVQICGDGAQVSLILPYFHTTIVLDASGYITAQNSDVGKVVQSLTTILPRTPGSGTEAIGSDVGKTVTNGTGATGKLVRYVTSIIAPFWEVAMISGAFAAGDTLSITAGTGTGTVYFAPINTVNQGTLYSFNNSTHTWIIDLVQEESGYFWKGAAVTIVSGTAGTATMTSDAIDDYNSVFKFNNSVAPSSNLREYISISGLGGEGFTHGRWAFIDGSYAPSASYFELWVNNFFIALKQGSAWNTKPRDLALIHCRGFGIYAPSATNAVDYNNVTITGNDKIESRCYYGESSYGVSFTGGAWEDGWYNFELQAGNYTISGYQESTNEGSIGITGNQTVLNLLNYNVSNPGKYVIRSMAGNAQILAQNMIIAGAPNLVYAFQLVSGCILRWGNIITDDAAYRFGGAKFSNGGFVDRFAPVNGRDDTFRFGSSVTAASEVDLPTNGDIFEIEAGTGTINRIKTEDWRVGQSFWTLNGGTVIYAHLAGAGTAGYAQLSMIGSVNQTVISGEWIQWRYDGTYFRQMISPRVMANPTFTGTITASGLSGTGNRLTQSDSAGVQSASIAVPTGAISETRWTKTASTTVANTTTETTLLDTGVGSKTLAAAFLTAGKSIVFEISGVYSTTLTPTIQFKFKLGSVVILDSGAITTANTVTNQPFCFYGTLTCRTTGATGTVFCQGVLLLGGVATPFIGVANTGTATIDTTGTLAMDLTSTWGSLSISDSITATNALLESKG